MEQKPSTTMKTNEKRSKENLFLKLLLKIASVLSNLLIGLAGLIFVGGVSFLILFWPLKLLSDIHWLFGMGMGMVIIGAFFMLWDKLNEYKPDNSSQLYIKFKWLQPLIPFLQSLVSAIVLFAWASWLLDFTGLTNYVSLSGSSLRDFVYYYFLLFLDMVPGLELLETLHLDYLIKSSDFVGGIPVVLFRGFIIFVLLKFLKDNWKKINPPKLPTDTQQ